MKPWQRQVGILFLFKAGYLLLVAGMVSLFPAGRDSAMGPVDHIRWTAEGHPTFESYFTTWDSGHYLYLSEHGYLSGQEQCAFYPLWPLLIRWFSILTAGDLIISGMILANVFSLTGFFIFYRLVAKRLGESISWASILLLAAFPGSLFFQFIYSESLFFLLVMLLCFALDENLLGLAFVSAFLLPMTRAVGIFCILPIAVHLITRWSRQFPLNSDKRSSLLHLIGRFLAHKKAGSADTASPSTIGPVSWWLLTAPFYGWAAYLALMWTWTGNPFEGFEAQRFWGVQSINNLFDVPKFAGAFFTPSCWHGYIGSTLDRVAFAMLLSCLPLVWRLDKIWFVWAIVLGVVPAMSGHFTSFIRFGSTVFPAFIALAAWFTRRRRALFVLWVFTLSGFIALHLILLSRFLRFEWAG